MSKPEEKTTSVKWLWALLALIFIVWGISGLMLYGVKERGTFGDMFGAINALFSGCAFATLIFTIWMQREELGLQRRELELTRKEMAGQKEQLESQASTLKLQQFESTFFSLLRTQQDIVNATDLVDQQSRITTKSRDCYKVFYSRLKGRWMYGETYENPLEGIRYHYGQFYEDIESEVGHYFRHLYHLIKLIKNSGVENPKQYTNLVRAQLSSNELLLLFYNGLADTGRDKFKPLIEEFSLLKNLPTQHLLDHRHVNLYATGAFAGSPSAGPTNSEN